MAENYQDLLRQKAELDAKIESIRGAEKEKAIEKVKELVSEFELSPSDIFTAHGNIRGQSRSRGTAQAKYRDPATGATWSGRGREPRWLLGKNREDYAIK